MISCSPLIRRIGDSMGPVTSTGWLEGRVTLGLEQKGFLVAMHFGLRNPQYSMPFLALNAMDRESLQALSQEQTSCVRRPR
jgi:hypothetical protein